MEEQLNPYLVKRTSFENFKSSVCHRLKAQYGIQYLDYKVLVEILEQTEPSLLE